MAPPLPRTSALARLALAGGLVLLAACGPGEATSTVPPRAEPHHVLVFLVDTLRADHMSCYGYERETTPFIDQYLARGVRFDRALSQSSWTAPSVISLFTGRDVAGEALALPDGLPVLAESFQRAGYATAGFVLNPLITNPENRFDRGFDHFHTEGVLRRLTAWIQASKGRDTFTYVHLITPHDPYAIDPAYHHYTGGPGLVPAEVEARWAAAAEAGFELGPTERETMLQGRNGYDDDVRLTDSQFGQVILDLQAAGQLEDAVVALVSDHGEGLWTRPAFSFSPEMDGATTVEEAFKMTHGGQVYDELVHVPFLLWAPGVVGGGASSAQVSNVDLLPTLLELCDLPAPGPLSGRSLAPLLFDPVALARPDVDDGHAAMTATRYAHALYLGDLKLIEPTPLGRAEGLVTELFDLAADPAEDRNLAPARPELVARLRTELERRLELALFAPSDDPGGPTELSDANRAALRALGYTD